MKTKSTLTLITAIWITILMIAGTRAQSQENIIVQIGESSMSKGLQTCYSVRIPQAEIKAVQQGWIKHLQEDNKAKVKEIGHELHFSGGLKTEIFPDTISLYSLLIATDSAINLNVFLEIDSVFFTPNSDKTDLASDKIDNSLRNYIRNFAVDQYRIAVEDELKAAEKVLKDLQNDLEKLQKDEKNLLNDNVKMENEIESTELELTQFDNSLAIKNQEIIDHNARMQNIALETEKEAAKAKQKELEKEKNQLEKSRGKAKELISDNKSQIEKNKKAIKQSQEDQDLKQQDITKQNNLIMVVQNKLKGIK
ncbi:MAG TPA: hypothetical protein PKM34_08805 [Bacteroidales bacterium]|nr:hypothetical protein [Bacteroidales bacterium]HPI85809.1 hypothetical protein [Bacteroidales bacterium]